MSSTKAAIAILMLLSAAGCAAPTYEHAAGLGVTPIEQYPLSTTLAPRGILLTQHAWGLSQDQAAALNDLARDWRAAPEGRVLIEAPAQGGDAASATAYAARDALQRFGVPSGSIQVVGYDAASTAPVRISHLARQAKVDDCGRAWTDLTRTASNQPTSNFGCAVNSNLAAMIADPADIDRARGTDPVDAGRRQVVMDKYRAGETTSAETDEKADGAVSRAVN